MSSTTPEKPRGSELRNHPRLKSLFKDAESRHFSDDEFDVILKQMPSLAPVVATAKKVREIEKETVTQVVKEVFSQYDYEGNHDFGAAKCPRDVRYVVAYATMAMLSDDPRWFDDKLLLWLKTILQSFEFPERKRMVGMTIFADLKLEDALSELPVKNKSIYHCYYRLDQEFSKALGDEDSENFCPYIRQALKVLTEV